MNHKKLSGFLIGLVCLSVCFMLALCACSPTGQPPVTTEQPTTDPVTTDTVTTEPVTEAPTEAEATTEQTTEEPTEAPTEPSQNGGGSNMNTGTGGGYVPGTQDPTEPETTTEPVIEVPEAGSDTNAYVEQVSDTTGEFSTVLIAAGETIHYELVTPGSFLYVEDSDVSVSYAGTDYAPVAGAVEIALPADAQQNLALAFKNTGSEAKQFAVFVRDALGSRTNPIMIENIAEFVCESAQAEGTYYTWTADSTGILQIYNTTIVMTARTPELTAQVGDQTASISEEGRICLPVSVGEQVLIHAQPEVDERGNVTPFAFRFGGYIATVVDHAVEQLPTSLETVVIPAGESAYYNLSGLSGNILTVESEAIGILYMDSAYLPEDGVISFELDSSSTEHQVELFNLGTEDAAFTVSFGYPVGHSLNPEVLEELGEKATAVNPEFGGYYYSYTAPSAGVLTFQVWEYPATENAVTDIVLTNVTANTSAGMWSEDENGDPVNQYQVSLPVNAGDEITIQVTVENVFGTALEENLLIMGELYGAEDKPITVQHPGFTANVPAGTTLYYEGYNLNEMIFSLTSENVSVAHNGSSYEAVDSQIQFSVVAEGRVPAVFAITNTGTQDAQYEVSFLYPEGHMEKPAKLQLGVNSVTRKEGASDYYYTFTAPRAGVLTVAFDETANWVYAVDNLTTFSYGDTQFSDSDPLVSEAVMEVKTGDTIRVRVNTYDPDAPWAAPAGEVNFTASYESGPTAITNFSVPTNTTLLPGEWGVYTGELYGYILVIDTASNVKVVYDGQEYTPADGQIRVEFPQSGEGNVTYKVFNGEAVQGIHSMRFVTNDVGSSEHPATLGYGAHSFTQSKTGGSDYYYEYRATARGYLTLTFDTSVNAIFIINGQQTYLTHLGDTGCRIAVRAGMVVQIAVNTYDPANPAVSPEGTVNFTVGFQ